MSLNSSSRRELPSFAQIRQLHQLHGTPQRVRRHERAVALTALRLGRALVRNGRAVDLSLLVAAALTHDLRRTDGMGHDQTGARALREAGFPAPAKLVARHFELGRSPSVEAKLLYLADKMTSDHSLCTIDERERAMLAKIPPAAAQACRARLDAARAVADEFLRLTGKDAGEAAGSPSKRVRSKPSVGRS